MQLLLMDIGLVAQFRVAPRQCAMVGECSTVTLKGQALQIPILELLGQFHSHLQVIPYLQSGHAEHVGMS